MNGNEFLSVIGLPYANGRVKEIVVACGIDKIPQESFDSATSSARLTNIAEGLELTFEDERHLESKSRGYDERSLVFVNARMYSDASDEFKPFTGILPRGLSFDMGLKDVEAALGKKPVKDGKGPESARWEFNGYCVIVSFPDNQSKIGSIAIQTPTV